MVPSVQCGITTLVDTEETGMARRRSNPEPELRGQTVIIENEAIPVEYRNLHLDDVKLDPNNPRIQYAVKKVTSNGNISQIELRKLILEQPGVPELFKSIRDNGGLNEPIYVRPDGTIIEGNCRAATYLKLRESKPNEVQ